MTTLKIEGTVTEISSERWAAFEAFEKGNVKEWSPETGSDYWFIDAEGDVDDDIWSGGMALDKARQSIGNIYRTESEALAQVEKLKAKARIDKYIRDNGLEFVPDWMNLDQAKWLVYYSYAKGGFETGLYDITRVISPFELESRNDARQVIDNCTDDLKTLFGI